MLRSVSVATCALAILGAGAAQAATVTSLPYDGSPDWRTVIFGGTSMTLDPGVSTTMTTSQGRGVWFGSSGGIGPAISDAATGNALSLTASFSSDAADWSTYLTDGAFEAALQYRPTNCADNCYGETALDGVNLLFGNGASAINTFVSLDMTLQNTFSFLLRDGLVEYHVNGTRYAGQAFKTNQAPILVIGDGSGSTRSGVGSMTVYKVGYDNAPTGTVSLVPEPGAWAMMILGFGGVGAAMRRRQPAMA